MTALHRVKAYFGMVPADELDAYDGYGDDRRRYLEDRYDDDRYDRYGSRYDGGRYGDDRYGSRFDDDRHAERPERHSDRSDRYGDRYDERDRRGPEPLRTPRPRDPEPEVAEAEPASRPASRGRSWASNTGPNHTSVRSGPSSAGSRPPSGSSGGSPAVAAAASAPSASLGASGGPALAAVPSAGSLSDAGAPSTAGLTRGALAVDDAARRREAAPAAEPAPEPAAPAEITTLQPKSYNEARIIGERYRDGIPVIMNLTEMDDVAAKRLVDFAAGLAFALRGSIEKVTNRVFLLSPPNVEVSATDRRRLAENGFTGSS